ncbi:MAG: hypothetical protein KF802_01205 [Bdellovibrionaceae bacterium]|nr:hypothetical protein [Pseudobdellovibrionaceae bacterium]
MMDYNTAKALVDRQRELSQAEVIHGLTNREQMFQRVTLDLSVARSENNPYRIGFPFSCVFFETSSRPDAFFYLKPSSRDSQQPHLKMSYRDSWSVAGKVPEAFLHWPAQTGAKVELVVMIDSDMRSGSQISLTAGGVSISDGSTVETLAAVTVGIAASQIVPQDLLRKGVLIQNLGAEDIFLGDVSVTIASGIRLSSGESFQFKNQAALYGISGTAGQNVRLMKEAG